MPKTASQKSSVYNFLNFLWLCLSGNTRECLNTAPGLLASAVAQGLRARPAGDCHPDSLVGSHCPHVKPASERHSRGEACTVKVQSSQSQRLGLADSLLWVALLELLEKILHKVFVCTSNNNN